MFQVYTKFIINFLLKCNSRILLEDTCPRLYERVTLYIHYGIAEKLIPLGKLNEFRLNCSQFCYDGVLSSPILVTEVSLDLMNKVGIHFIG